ncbi:MAG: class I SAM-dependent methyltransferase [Gammaproteobacteria bacterium]
MRPVPGTEHQLLRASAPLAWQRAPAHCARSGADGAGSCAWYHRPWPLLRLLGVVSSAALHAALLGPALSAAARAGARRVLVCGSADFALPALVHAAYAQARQVPELCVLDRCRTPLLLCEWYAERCGHALETRHADILALPVTGAFDLICTHAFLGYFDRAARAALLARWHALLCPGGMVVTTQRLRPLGDGRPLGFAAAQRAAFVAAARAARAVLDGADAAALDGIDAAVVAAAADDFAARFVSYPAGDAAALAASFTAAGFVLDTFAVIDGPAPAAGASAPSVPGAGAYAHIVARRA